MGIPLENGENAAPKYLQVADIIRARIVDGTWHDALPPEKVLCTEFKIARGTLRQALQLLESEGYLYREQGRGTFVRAERPLAEGRSRHLAFVVPYIRDSSVSTILIGFQQVAEEAGFSVIFNHVNNDVSQQSDVLNKLLNQGVMGMALYPVDSDSPTPVDALVRRGFPVVLVDRYLRHVLTDYVMSDHFGGALRGVHYLIHLGHRRVGFVTWLSPAVSMEHRLIGYTQALHERDIPFDEGLICRVDGYPTVDLNPLLSYLSAPNRPTAVFAANDQIAIALYRAASAVGLRIPEDLSVIGFDNLDLAAHLDPPLTTVAQPFAEIGRRAAGVLLSRLRGASLPPQQISLQCDLLLRGSTAPVAMPVGE
jgi:GntR family transcriptional regulator of arabinose operon